MAADDDAPLGDMKLGSEPFVAAKAETSPSVVDTPTCIRCGEPLAVNGKCPDRICRSQVTE